MTAFSYQLYSSRNFPPMSSTLRMLADLGYTQVEGFGGLFETAEAVQGLKAGLSETGLSMPTAHMSLGLVQDEPARAIEIARSLGMAAVFVPHTTDQDRDASGWSAFGREIAEAGKPLQDAGLKFGWHNHDFEFNDLGGEDRPLDLILSASDDLLLELDVAWVEVSGQDPLKWISKYAERLLAAHVKDIAPEGKCVDEDGWADVGHGTMDWKAIMAALKNTSAEYFVLEHDNPSNDRRFAERSLAAAKTL
ncbi:MAG: sugar phosphate isomerase/epimerase [Paracoccaceae bacterium]|nr:sugar phosphate isomerase/epimerase [Paracoccaceae bacterium]